VPTAAGLFSRTALLADAAAIIRLSAGPVGSDPEAERCASGRRTAGRPSMRSFVRSIPAKLARSFFHSELIAGFQRFVTVGVASSGEVF